MSSSEQNERLNNVLRNSVWIHTNTWIDFFLGKEHLYYEFYKRYWSELSVLIDRVLFYHLWTQKILKNEDVKFWFEYAFEVLVELLEKNVYNIDSTRNKDVETENKPDKPFLW